MKKTAALALILSLLVGLTPAFAAGPAGSAPVLFSDESAGKYGPETASDRVNITLNGETLSTDVPGLIQTVDGQDGRTLVPVRTIAEPLGATVLWMEDTRQVLLFNSQDTIVLTLGSATAVVNGQNVQLPGGVPAGVVKCQGVERTMVPLRFVSEQLHGTVEWDNDTYTAIVTVPIQPPQPTPTPTPTPSPTPTPAPSPSVTPTNPDKGMLLRISADHNAETVTLSLSGTPKYQVVDLGDRVAVDLLGMTIGSGKDGSLSLENPVLTAVRYAQHTNDLYPEYGHTVRVVLDLAKGCTYKKNVVVEEDTNAQTITVSVLPPDTGTEPALPPVPLDPTAFTVVLDAGHGGSASGAFYEEIAEKTITLPITLKTEALLKAHGYNVVMTRTTDVYMDLYDRSDVANNINADIFVSIHANVTTTNPAFEGTFTYYYPDSGKGKALAQSLQSAIVASAGSVDRGLLTNDYVVLRETNMPAALIETGFMTCHAELMRLIDDAYQDKLAQGIANGIINYLNTLPKKTAEATPSATPIP